MLIEKLTGLSAVSSETYTYTDPIDLNRKWLDGHKLSLKVDLMGTVSGTMHMICEEAESNASGTTWAPIVYGGSGTSVIISGGTLSGGVDGAGTYNFPLTYFSSGVTDYMLIPPFIRFGHRATADAVDFQLTLIGS